jgi:hypothetical protein
MFHLSPYAKEMKIATLMNVISQTGVRCVVQVHADECTIRQVGAGARYSAQAHPGGAWNAAHFSVVHTSYRILCPNYWRSLPGLSTIVLQARL